jgi:hypothetical protein
LLFAMDALDAGGDTVQSVMVFHEDSLDLFALTCQLGAQTAALDLDFAEATIDRGKVSAPGRLGNGYAGKDGQQLRGIGQQSAELRQRAKIGQREVPSI